jgi:uncharacterized protein YdhG (YjbR/CyaY superfamily)
MKQKETDVDAYVQKIAADRKKACEKLRSVIRQSIPQGFEEVINYGMPSYVVPHSLYPDGYHCDPKLPLPFVSFASQKNFIAVYHMGIYANEDLMNWFVGEYPNHCSRKLDMGKSCIRFKKIDEIPYDLIGELMRRISVENWISLYEESVKR